MSDRFDMKLYGMAMINFGPSILLGDRWISLGSIEQIIQMPDGTISIWFKSATTWNLSPEESRNFHQAMTGLGRDNEDQIRAQQAQQAQAAGKMLGIIKGN